MRGFRLRRVPTLSKGGGASARRRIFVRWVAISGGELRRTLLLGTWVNKLPAPPCNGKRPTNGLIIATQNNSFCQKKKNVAEVEARKPPPEKACGHQRGRWSQWCTRPPRAGRGPAVAPSLGAGSSLGGMKRRRGAGRWWCFTTPSSRRSRIQLQESRPSSPASASSLPLCWRPSWPP